MQLKRTTSIHHKPKQSPPTTVKKIYPFIKKISSPLPLYSQQQVIQERQLWTDQLINSSQKSIKMDKKQKQDTYNLVKYLNAKDREHVYVQKNFCNHSKKSDLQEVKKIIQELLDKHAKEGKISSSEQFILLGYLAKYLDFASNNPKMLRNPFGISQRLQKQNNMQCIGLQTSSQAIRNLSKRSKSPKKSYYHSSKQSKDIDSKKQLIQNQFQKLKFLWQLYQLKCLVCPTLTIKISDEQNKTRHQLLEMIGKLRNLEKNRVKVGEEKVLNQVGKIIKNFQAKIKDILL